MKAFIQSYGKTLVFFAVIGLIGGFFTGLYLLDSYPPAIQQQLLDEMAAEGLDGIPANLFLAIVTALQAAGYGLGLGAIGIPLSKRIGLWKDERTITKKPLIITIIAGILGGMALILPDFLYFSHHCEAILQSYATKPTVPYLLAAILYGGVIEEVILRLFLMSLMAFLLFKVFQRKRETPSTAILVGANLLSAILFAAGHLPATFVLLGDSPMILFRCFLLNGSFGLLFGWLYRKYGLRYAMIAHGGCHIVSKLIWILFL